MPDLARMPLEGGGEIFFEDVAGELRAEGPVRAGRLGDVVRELPRTVQESLVPVRETARAVLDQLRDAGPQEVEVEFGVNLSVKAGAVITGSEAAAHLKVRMVWKRGESGSGASEDARG
jgi:hypothetical protein